MIRANKKVSIFVLSLTFAFVASSSFAAETGAAFTSFMGFALDGDVTLQQITKTLGAAPVVEKTDDNGYEASICYQAKDGFVQFLSSDQGGAQQGLLGVSLSIQAPNGKCAPLPPAYAAQDLKIGTATLGMKKDAFVQAVGGKVTTDKLTVAHVFSYQRPFTPAEKAQLVPGDDSTAFDGQITVEGQFTKDALSTLQVWKTETD